MPAVSRGWRSSAAHSRLADSGAGARFEPDDLDRDLSCRLAARRTDAPRSRLRETAALAASELDALPKPQGVICHSDLHTQNLIESDAALLLLDWEYAHVTDPLWDAAGWSANNDFDGTSQRTLLADYLGGAPTADDWARFSLLGWLYDYVCLLWSGVYLAAGRDPSGLIGARARQLDARLRIPAHYRA